MDRSLKRVLIGLTRLTGLLVSTAVAAVAAVVRKRR
jgi:hypothetical protein